MDKRDRLIQVLEGIEKQLSILNRRLSTKHNDKYYSITDLLLAVINEYVGDLNVISNKNDKTDKTEKVEEKVEDEIMNELIASTPYNKEEINNWNKSRITKKI